MSQFDAIIIGTGQAGPALAARLTGAGMTVAVVERGKFGGTCINTGCTPTKTLVASAYAAHLARRAADLGVTVEAVSVDMKQVKARKNYDQDTKQILGASILGTSGDEVIHTILALMYARAPYTVLQRAMHIHPTVSELLPTLAGQLKPLSDIPLSTQVVRNFSSIERHFIVIVARERSTARYLTPPLFTAGPVYASNRLRRSAISLSSVMNSRNALAIL